MWILPATLALIFLAGVLFLFPILAALFHARAKVGQEETQSPNSIDIIIPCHNEEGRLRTSLESVSHSVRELQSCFPKVKVRVICGLDDCNDGTENDAHFFAVETKIFKDRSKWKVIKELISCSSADWIVLLDAGIVWDYRLLRNSIPILSDSSVMGFCPTYGTIVSRLLGRLHWALEAALKGLENRSGGPISLHGATVFYRTQNVQSILGLLEGREWINDDVVLPLMMRFAFPHHRILYSQNAALGFIACDTAPRSKKKDPMARLRIAQGNRQWIQFILPMVWLWNKRIFVLSLRRVLRLYWALPAHLVNISISFAAYQYLPFSDGMNLGCALVVLLTFNLALRRIPGFIASQRSMMTLLGKRSSHEETIAWN